MKKCRTCDQIEPLDEFTTNSRNKDKKEDVCRDCISERQKKRHHINYVRKVTFEQRRDFSLAKARTLATNRRTAKLKAIKNEYADAIEFVYKVRKKRLGKEWKAANPEKIREQRERERVLQRVLPEHRAKKKLANPATMTRSRLNKKAFKRQQREAFENHIPRHWEGWKEMREQILDIYMAATEISWFIEELITVDHIIPINGELVSGLHVPANLQLLPFEDNIAKSNSYHYAHE